MQCSHEIVEARLLLPPDPLLLVLPGVPHKELRQFITRIVRSQGLTNILVTEE